MGGVGEDLVERLSGLGGLEEDEGGSALAIWARASAGNGTSKSLDIDYIAAWKLRKKS